MNPIRPQLPPSAAPARPAADARAAFFQSVKAPAPAAPLAPATQRPAPAAPAPTLAGPQATGEAPTRYLRPGSLVDIKV